MKCLILKNHNAIESNRELSNSFDLYQLDTSGGSYDCNLPRISSLYPLRTRVIRFIDLFEIVKSSSHFEMQTSKIEF